MPNGGGTRDRVAATLRVFGPVCDTSSSLAGSVQDPLTFRVVSAAFDGLSDSARAALVLEALVASAWSPIHGGQRGPRKAGVHLHLFGARIEPTGRADGEFYVDHEVIVVDARAPNEMGEEP